MRGTRPLIRILGRSRARDCSVPFGGRGDLTPFRVCYRSDPILSALGASVLAVLSLGEDEGWISAATLDNLSHPESGFFSVPLAVVAIVCYARSTDRSEEFGGRPSFLGGGRGRPKRPVELTEPPSGALIPRG